MEDTVSDQTLAADEAKQTIWDAFRERRLDEDDATAHLLSLDLEERKRRARHPTPPDLPESN